MLSMRTAASGPRACVRFSQLSTKRTGEARKVALKPACASNVSVQLAGEDQSLAPALASAMFVAGKQGLLNITQANAQIAIGAAAVLLPAINLIMRSAYQNEDIGALAPATIATSMFDFATLSQAAVVFFGSSVATALENVIDINGAYYVIMAGLAAAAYAGIGAVAFCLAVNLLSGYEVLSSARNDSKVLIAPLALSTVTGYALFRFAVDSCKVCAQEALWAIILARLAWGAISVVRNVVNSSDN